MATYSGYALPTSGAPPIRSHGHSRSYHGGHLSPAKGGSNGSNGNGTLHTLLETSPVHSPDTEANRQIGENNFAFNENKRLHTHSHSHPPPMKSRGRGESDLGRPPDPRGNAYAPHLTAVHNDHDHGHEHSHESRRMLPELLTGLLIPLPYMLASAAFPRTDVSRTDDLQEDIPLEEVEPSAVGQDRISALARACTLTAGTLLLVGVAAKIKQSQKVLDRRKDISSLPQQASAMLTGPTLQAMAMRVASVGLPFYSALELGGLRVGLALVTAVTSNILCSDKSHGSALRQWKHFLSSRRGTLAVLVSGMLADFSGLTTDASLSTLLAGYFALSGTIFVLQYPLPKPAGSRSHERSSSSAPLAVSSLVATKGDTNITLTAGAVLSVLTLIALFALTGDAISTSNMVFAMISISLMATTLFVSRPTTLRSQGKAGLGLGCLLSASCAFLFSPNIWPSTIINGGLSALVFLGVLYDTTSTGKHIHHSHEHNHDHTHHVHSHDYDHRHKLDFNNAIAHLHGPRPVQPEHSMFTHLLMMRCEPGSLVSGILSDKDSRRIAYFTCLNFGFMLVQGVYGYLSGSLGLLSDTVHMFFDCLGLVIGLGAAVASKWPTSPEKPYGWGKLNTLAGFGNGIFLMLVSVEFVWEAMEGIMEGKELRRVQELLVVSTLGLLVNMVGLFAFGHAHHGHDHGHGHGHDHGHNHGHGHGHDHGQGHCDDHSHSHGHDHNHSHSNGHAHGDHCNHSHDHKPTTSHSHDAHAHAHNENMHGIYLHVAADAGGSLAVIISTALTLWKPWYLWDPLATILIAALIFVAAVPLVTSSGQKLLLVIPDKYEYGMKNALQEIAEIRGVVGYAVPRFWIDDKDAGGGGGHHHHHHGHDHGEEAGAVQVILGVIHIIAGQAADLEDVRRRVEDFVRERGMDVVVHVEHEGEGCWCDGGKGRSF